MSVRSFALLLVALSTAGCEPERHVSPWGNLKMPPLGAFVEQPNLAAHVSRMDRESAAEGLVPRTKATARSRDGTIYELRAFEGKDRLGRTTTAVRVASPWGVVLAIGPLAETDGWDRPTTFVPSFTADAGAALQFPVDLTGDGYPEVLLSSPRGNFAVWSLAPKGAVELRVELAHPPRELRTLGAGFALWTRTATTAALVTASFDRVAAFENGTFTEASAPSRSWHAAEARVRAQPPASGEMPAQTLRREAELAFHRALSTADLKARTAVFTELDAKPAPAELAADWEQAKRDLADELRIPRPQKK